MLPEKIETDVRCRVLWGESPKAVYEWLVSTGAGEEESAALIAACRAERDADIRSLAIRKIVSGCGLMLVPVATYATFLAMRIFFVRVLGATVAIGLFGLWRVTSGAMALLFPSLERGDISEGI